MNKSIRTRKVRYAVIGLGHIAQVAVLPAFAHAAPTSVLTALVSDDSEKLRQLGQRYSVKVTYPYERYDECLRSGDVDACLHRAAQQHARRILGSGGECRRPRIV